MPDEMKPMDAWHIVAANLMELYKRRKANNCIPYVDAELQAEVMCFMALKQMEESCKKTENSATGRYGKWTLHKDGSGTCNQCRITQKNVWDYDNHQNYCGHCGAKNGQKGESEWITKRK